MTRRRRPNSSKKMAEEAKKNVPPGYTVEEWMKKQEQDAIAEVIEERKGHMMNQVMEAIQAIEIKRRHKKHVIEEALNCAHALVELSFLRRDDGESAADAETWQPDEEPITVPIDTWAPGSVPVVEVPPEEVIRTMPASLRSEVAADMTESDGRTPLTSPHTGSPAPRRSGRTGWRKRRTSTSSGVSGVGTFRSRSSVLSPQSIPTLQEEEHGHPHQAQSQQQVGIAASLSSTGRLRPKSSGISTPLSESKKQPPRGAPKEREASSAPARRISAAQPAIDADMDLVPPRPPPTVAPRGSARARLRRHIPTAVPFEGNQQQVLPDIGQESAPSGSSGAAQHRQQTQQTQQAQPVSTR